MKKLFFALLVISLVMVLPAIGCKLQVETYTDDSQIINVSSGDEFIISLASNVTTGYSWQVEYNDSLLELVSQEYVPDEADSDMVGVGGTEEFRFKALKEGSTQITFSYQRSGEDEPIEQQVFEVNIEAN